MRLTLALALAAVLLTLAFAVTISPPIPDRLLTAPPYGR